MTIVEGELKISFSIATTPMYRRGCYSFLWNVPLTCDPYFIMLSVKQRSIKYHFFSLRHDLTRDWTLVSRTTGEYSNHYANGIEFGNNELSALTRKDIRFKNKYLLHFHYQALKLPVCINIYIFIPILLYVTGWK